MISTLLGLGISLILSSKVSAKLDILISETEIDDSCPSAQFLIQGFTRSCRLDCTSNGGGTLVYLRQDIPIS